MNEARGRSEDVDDLSPQAERNDWEWRRKIRSNPHTHLIYRFVVGVLGLLIVVVGLIMVPFPGPGWVVVFIGLAVWATEFAWAQRLLRRARSTLQAWNDLLKPQPWWVKAMALLVTLAAVAAFFWLLFLVSGVPSLLPDTLEGWLTNVPGLSR